MNTFIQWQETISDAYLTDTPSYFSFIEPNISLLPQGSLASIPSNALIFIFELYFAIVIFDSELHPVIVTCNAVCEIPGSFERASPSNFRTQGSFIHMNSRKIFERGLISSDSVAKSAT